MVLRSSIQLSPDKNWVDADLALSNGDSEKSETSLDVLCGRGYQKHISFVSLSYGYAKSQNVVNKDNAFMHLRHIHHTSVEHLDWEAFYQLGQDEQSDIKKRQVLGSGLRQNWKASPSSSFFLGAGAMYEEKEFNAQVRRTGMLGNFYVSGKKEWANKNSLLLISYFQPKLSDFSDFDTICQGVFSVPILDNLAFNVKAAYTHTETPARNKHRDNTSTVFGLSFKF
jgi:hypothetical protein